MRSGFLWIVSRCLVALAAALLSPIAPGQTSTLRVVTSEASFGAPALSDDAGRVVLQASGGSLPYSFSIKAGVLPPGLAIAGSSAISGIYEAAGTWSFTLQVTDGKKRVATRDLTLSVYPVPRPIPANIPFTISCPYMPRPKWPSHGTEFFLLNNERDAIKATQGQRIPLLGQYDGTNTEVIDWQVNWATGVGITNFAFNDWWMQGVEHPLYSTSLNAFLASRYGAQMTFSVQYNGGRTFTNQDAAQALFLEHALPFYATNYFTRPNYFRIDGLPVIQILNIGAAFGSYDPGTIKAAIERANAVICEATKGESCGAYWICSDIGVPTVDFSLVGSAGFNAVHPYYVTQHIWPEYTPALWNAHLRTDEERFGNADWTSYRRVLRRR